MSLTVWYPPQSHTVPSHMDPLRGCVCEAHVEMLSSCNKAPSGKQPPVRDQNSRSLITGWFWIIKTFVHNKSLIKAFDQVSVLLIQSSCNVKMTSLTRLQPANSYFLPRCCVTSSRTACSTLTGRVFWLTVSLWCCETTAPVSSGENLCTRMTLWLTPHTMSINEWSLLHARYASDHLNLRMWLELQLSTSRRGYWPPIRSPEQV